MRRDDTDIFGYNLGGSVGDYFDDGLQPIMRPEKPELPSKAQVAAVGAGILGGTPYGLIDIFGGAPEIPADPNTTVGEMFVGPRSPSLAENIRQGNIIDPLLQLAGVAPFAAAATMPIRRARALSQLELPSDTASRMSRAQSGGYNTDVYHGSTHDVYAFDAENASDMSDFGRGVYLTNNPEDASTNYAGVGTDLQTRIDQATEYHTEVSGMHPALAAKKAREELIGEASRGVVYPLKLNTDNFVKIGRDGTVIPAGSDYRQSAIDDIESYDGGRKAFDSDDAYEDAVYDRAIEFYDTDIDSNYLKLKDFLSGYGADERLTSDILQDVFDGSEGMDEINATQLVNAFNKNYLMDGRRTPSAMAAEFFKDELNYEGIIDRNVNKKFRMQGMDDETEHYIVFSGSENKIRSPQAQFDPSQKDSADILRAGGGEVDKEDIFGYNLGGSVGQYFDEYGNPVTPEITQETPLTPAQTANILGGLAPGAGMADISGLYSAFPPEGMTTAEMIVGPRSPSLAENIRNKEVIDSGLQILGGIGDLIPPVAAAIAPLRAARAAKKLKTYARRSDEGFYSAAEEAALNLERKKGSGQAFINDLQKSGAKPDELRASGFIDIFSEKPDVTRDDVIDYFQTDEPIIKIKTISDAPQKARNVTENEIADYILDEKLIGSGELFDEFDKTIHDYDMLQGGNLLGKSPQERDQIVNNYRALLDNYRVEAQEAAQARQESLQAIPEYKSYTLDEGRSGDNYKETIIKLPNTKKEKLDKLQLARADANNALNLVKQRIGYLEGGRDLPPSVQRVNPGGAEEQLKNFRLESNSLEGTIKNLDEQISSVGDVQDNYAGGHYSRDLNVLAHLRTMDRVDTDGKKVLLIEEIQSDWHQRGAEFGYKRSELKRQLDDISEELQAAKFKYKKDGKKMLEELGFDELFSDEAIKPEVLEQKALGDRIQELREMQINLEGRLEDSLPDAPFKTGDKSSWYNLTLKKALQDAVDGGYDKLALTTGRQQADRYNQTKNVSNVKYLEDIVEGRPVNVLTAYGPDGSRVFLRRIEDPEKDIPEYIGKDAAKKLLDQKTNRPLTAPELQEYENLERAIPNLSRQQIERQYALTQLKNNHQYEPNIRALSGLDIDVGGEGMKQFYDKTYVNALNKLVKPDGVKVGKTKLTSKRTRRVISDAEKEEYDDLLIAQFNDRDLTEAQLERFELLKKKDNALERDEDTVHSIDITPEMRKRVQMGLELFADGGEVDKRSAKDKLRDIIESMMGDNTDATITALEFTPVVGDLMGGIDIFDSISEGDMYGAGINTMAAMAGMVPGPPGDLMKKAMQRVRVKEDNFDKQMREKVLEASLKASEKPDRVLKTLGIKGRESLKDYHKSDDGIINETLDVSRAEKFVDADVITADELQAVKYLRAPERRQRDMREEILNQTDPEYAESLQITRDTPEGYNLGGSVSDLIRDPSMSNLQREAPSLSPAQAANIGGGFLPYSGMADIFGEYAAFPTDPNMTTAEMIVGPRGPSLAENIRNREIIDSGLQIAGGIGDLFPPLMAAVAPMRVARAASKAADKLPSKPSSRPKKIYPERKYDERFDPRVGEIDRLNNLRYEIESRAESIDPKVLRLSDLEGEKFVTSMSDRTRAGGLILGIDGVPLYRAVDLRGGQGFMFENPNQVWASAEKPANDILKMAKEMKKSSNDPLFLPWRMAPTGGDFSTTTGELMLGFASANMNKSTKRSLDKAIKNFKTVGSMVQGKRVNQGRMIQGWKGVDDPSSVEVWRNTPDSVRKELMNMMDVQFRKKGGLSIGAARLINTDPLQVLARDAGIQNVGRIYTGEGLTASTHPSYPFAVPGEGIGSLPKAGEATIFDLIPEARLGAKQQKVKDPAKPTTEEIRALQMKPYGGTVTENILRRMEDRGVDINSLTGLAPGALAFTLISGSLISPEEVQAGGLENLSEKLSVEKKSGVKKKFDEEEVGISLAAGGIVSLDDIDSFG